MTAAIDPEQTRIALAQLPKGTSHADSPDLAQVYLPPSHLKAMDPDNMLVTGMRGAGKTFWWGALQEPDIRQLIDRTNRDSTLSENTEVRTGFGVRPAPDDYPDKDVLRRLLLDGAEPRTIWRAVQAWQLAGDDHPIRRQESWKERLNLVDREPEAIARLFLERDNEFHEEGIHLLLLFDALDRCSDDWRDMYRLIRGLMQTALDMRSYRRLRVKMFLRSDQVDETQIADFPDASKVLSSAVDLSWPASELYGLLWHSLINGAHGQEFRTFIADSNWHPIQIGEKQLFSVSRRLISKDDLQRERFHSVSGPFMGRNRRRGFPYTWIPNHLGDTEKRVSPRSFLRALRTAAEETAEHYPEHKFALHYESIKRGVQAASKTRVNEVKEDYPWVDRLLICLEGMTVPCKFEEVEERWNEHRVLDRLSEDVEQGEVKLPPRHIEDGARGIRLDLETLGVFLRMRDDRVNIPDVFRVGYRLGRKGGVRVAR
ncbi:MAG: hypothetical protein OXI22_10495 [Defluviicoccus sp.]|nr:hypothetical protein [Defluviicoccus sp.]MDE0384304.1 hypothetical protein [Defluviicoccus sp.]